MMTEEYYLTDNIRMINDKMEYREYDIFKIIKNHNWHHVLSEYGWQKINKPWITKLNKLSKLKEKNSLYGVLDCETDGDCFFHCIANALNERDRETNNYYDSNDIREIISDNITEEQYDTIIGYYRIMKDADDFSEGWDPYSIHSIEEFKDKIKTSGHEYWGDHILLQVLINILRINVFILNCNSLINDYSVYNTLSDYNPEYGSIFLIYEDMCHFKLLGHFNGKMISYFTDSALPYELRKLYELKF
jgi:hypothetical protein